MKEKKKEIHINQNIQLQSLYTRPLAEGQLQRGGNHATTHGGGAHSVLLQLIVNQNNQVKRCSNCRPGGEMTTTCTLHTTLLLILVQQAVGKITRDETTKPFGILAFVFA